jgi:hypothetical protein
MFTTTFNWHPHTDEPEFPIAAVIIAVPPCMECDVPIIVGLFEWSHGRLNPTDFSMNLPDAPFYWAYEQDLCSGIMAALP